MNFANVLRTPFFIEHLWWLAVSVFGPMLLIVTYWLLAQLLLPLLNLALIVEMCLVEIYFVSIALENVRLNCLNQFLFHIFVKGLLVTSIA